MILMQKPTILLEKKTEFFCRVTLVKISLVLEILLALNGEIQLQLCDGTIFILTNFFSNTSVIYSNYDYKITIGGAGFDIASVIKDWTFKQDYQWFANDDAQCQIWVQCSNAQNFPGRNKQH